MALAVPLPIVLVPALALMIELALSPPSGDKTRTAFLSGNRARGVTPVGGRAYSSAGVPAATAPFLPSRPSLPAVVALAISPATLSHKRSPQPTFFANSSAGDCHHTCAPTALAIAISVLISLPTPLAISFCDSAGIVALSANHDCDGTS